jgi:3-phenylpropionate/trans-cinnamate dioxygenase ferredoxin reductase subunit
MSEQTFMIVGASLAGAKAAQTLREEGFEGRVLVIGEEAHRPYERPPLTKEYLRGEAEREKTYVHGEGFYGDHELELITSATVTELAAGEHRVALADGRELSYDRLLLATGSAPRRIAVPGAELDGVYYMRTLGDADALRERLGAGGRVAVVGAGWIGSEFAASARQGGLDVTLIDPLALPNERIFGPEIGSFYRHVHAQHGVHMALGEGVERFEGDGRVQRVRTSTGRTVECDFAVVGIGVVPRVELAEHAGAAIENGIAVDERLASSLPDVFAAGDVASAWHPFLQRRIRVEHWSNALHQGPAAARSMLGRDVSYDRIPYFFSDQYDVGMEYSGYATEWDEVVFRGDRDGGEFIAFWLKDGRVLAGMNVNVWDVAGDIQALIRSRRAVDRQALTDPDTSLKELASEKTPPE